VDVSVSNNPDASPCASGLLTGSAAVVTGSSRASREADRREAASLEFATPEQTGVLAAFLCSSAAAQIRGAALLVDGGWTAQ
jgi:NAD(P)-dependent dehydrogenase (short-subunit alcohol dehydrogenase family)